MYTTFQPEEQKSKIAGIRKAMSFWKKLFGSGSKPGTPITPKPPQPSEPKPTAVPSPPADKGYVVISGSSENMEPIARAEGLLTTRPYDGGPVEPFFERMSKDLISKHGPLVGVDYVSHFPKFEIWFRYKDGAAIYSG